ncbi:helix-turn-helix domain-containing protein [Pelagibius litoralis]|uniref:Helix-turn-helix domain-containing protein n=1 Tax=Pelagibius litoralis TaxID=374515 RepID=A0A967KAA1_9PROT|nr:helix-turn-helix domain-containing protein [Pelagibius litoralis]NIA70362.1 helix-turn-helix domain-containing protein [Pelagibius litoralis]
MAEIEKVMKILGEELAALDMSTNAEAFVRLVLEAVANKRKLQIPKATPLLSAAEKAAYLAGGFDLCECEEQIPGSLERAMAEYVALIATALPIHDAARLLGVHCETIQNRLHRRELFGIKHRGRWLLPRFQFHHEETLPGLEEVAPAIDPDAQPISLARFFHLPQNDLVIADAPAPLSPRDWLMAGYSPTRVAALARELILL